MPAKSKVLLPPGWLVPTRSRQERQEVLGRNCEGQEPAAHQAPKLQHHLSRSHQRHQSNEAGSWQVSASQRAKLLSSNGSSTPRSHTKGECLTVGANPGQDLLLSTENEHSCGWQSTGTSSWQPKPRDHCLRKHPPKCTCDRAVTARLTYMEEIHEDHTSSSHISVS